MKINIKVKRPVEPVQVRFHRTLKIAQNSSTEICKCAIYNVDERTTTTFRNASLVSTDENLSGS